MISPMVQMLDVALMGSVLLRGKCGHLVWLDVANNAHRWDPATGLGTPNYPKLKKLFLSLP
jgi:hypothetical protein